jgi:hypothetical protein
MTRRPLPFALLLAAACGSGHLVPEDTHPAAAPSSEPTAAAPAPAAEPAAAPAPQEQPSQPSSNVSAYIPYDAGALPIRRIGQWSTSGIVTPERLVIRDDSSYARFWTGLGAGSRPSVDFSRDVVIVAAAGQQQTGGHGIEVSRVVRAGQGLAVEVLETAPGPGCAVTQALTQPVDVVVVPVGDAKTWSFSERTVAQACR